MELVPDSTYLPFFLLKPLRRKGSQLLHIIDNIADIVRHLANSGRNIIPLLEHDDFGVRIRPFRLTCGTRSRCRSSDDEDPSLHFFFSMMVMGTPLNPKCSLILLERNRLYDS